MNSMEFLDDIAALEALYGTAGAASMRKVVTRLTPLTRQWIAMARYGVLTTVGPDGTDGSPRGDDGAVVVELDENTLLMPDWRGNNRLDSLRNIVVDGRVSLMLMVAGSTTVLRINGRARLTAQADLRARFDRDGKQPATVIVIRIAEIYPQCARAQIRADLWRRDDSAGVPSVGALLAEASQGEEGGAQYDAAWPARAAKSMW